MIKAQVRPELLSMFYLIPVATNAYELLLSTCYHSEKSE